VRKVGTDFLLKTFDDWFACVIFVKTDYLNIDMCKSESSQMFESEAQSADSMKACSKTRAFGCKIIAVASPLRSPVVSARLAI